ncbi:MAG TPA: hypothetical protein PLI68_05520 [Bacteroidia bacterium]|nr:hypothetical protein [Bacteroidia bacterium]HRH08009.1 hypothetical protein [Bacteroidia bacterium]HRH62768.1 hypothetical protein [Bacteroidia bacterium]
MKKLVLSISIATALCINTQAQNQVDALRYSQITYGGTARYVGVGGAFGAFGADASALSSNPAGIGMYRKSDLTFTPTFYNGNTTSAYNGATNRDAKLNFNFGNAAFIINIPKAKNDGSKEWKSLSFGISYNRQNNFHNRIFIEGNTNGSSLLKQYVAEANGYNPLSLNLFGNDLAYQTYLIDTIPGETNSYFANTNFNSATHKKSIEQSGAMGETALSFGANYNNKLYLGASIGFDKIKYEESSRYEESDNDTGKTGNYISLYKMDLKKFVLDEKYSTSGRGINLKAGAIYSVFDWLKIGAAVHSPTYFYSMTDTYSDSITAMYSYFETPDSTGYYPNGRTLTYSSPEGLFEYSLSTPFRAIASIGFLINKRGLISADYEYVNYSQARLNSDNDEFRNANKSIQMEYTAASNIRIGTEWRFEPFSVRAGYSYYGSPYKDKINNGSRSTYSIGFGYKLEVFYLDIAYQLTQSKERYYMYDAGFVNESSNKIQSGALLTTVGFKF